MIFNSKDIKHIAHLAKLEMTDAEIEKFLPQISQILTLAKMLDEVDTSLVQPISQITGIQNMIYKDAVDSFPHPEKLLAQSPQEVQGNMIKVKNIF